MKEEELGKFSDDFIKNFKQFENLLKESVEKLDSGEGLTSEEIRTLFKAASKDGVDEIERERMKAEEGYISPKEKDALLLATCTLSFPKGWRKSQKSSEKDKN